MREVEMETHSVALVADADHVEVDSLLLELLGAGLDLLDGVGVVAAAETAVAGEADQEDLCSPQQTATSGTCKHTYTKLELPRNPLRSTALRPSTDTACAVPATCYQPRASSRATRHVRTRQSRCFCHTTATVRTEPAPFCPHSPLDNIAGKRQRQGVRPCSRGARS